MPRARLVERLGNELTTEEEFKRLQQLREKKARDLAVADAEIERLKAQLKELIADADSNYGTHRPDELLAKKAEFETLRDQYVAAAKEALGVS